MGNGLTMPHDLKLSVSRKLEEEHKKLVAEGKTDKSIHKILKTLYEELVSAEPLPLSTIDGSNMNLVNNSDSKETVPLGRLKGKTQNIQVVTDILPSNKTSARMPLRKTPTVQSPSNMTLKLTPVSKESSPSTRHSYLISSEANFVTSSTTATASATSLISRRSKVSPNVTAVHENRLGSTLTPASDNKAKQISTPKAIGVTSGSKSIPRSKSLIDTSGDAANSITMSRDKSYGKIESPKNSSTIVLVTATEEAQKINVAPSDPVIDSNDDLKPLQDVTLLGSGGPDAIDNWDSVSKQPFCTICKMAFKSDAFLQRHLKFSEVHQQNLLELDYMDNSSDGKSKTIIYEGPINVSSIKSQSNPKLWPSFRMNAPLPVDGVDYRLIYSGVKFIWRTKENLDLDMYYHIKLNTVEVVPFDSANSKEYARLYFRQDLILMLVAEDIKAKVDARVRELSSDRFALIPSKEILFAEAQQNTIATYILSRLQKVEDNVVFVSSYNNTTQSPLLITPPRALMPVLVVRRIIPEVRSPDTQWAPSTPPPISSVSMSSQSLNPVDFREESEMKRSASEKSPSKVPLKVDMMSARI